MNTAKYLEFDQRLADPQAGDGIELIDSHCHMHFPALRERIDQVLADMQKASVCLAVNVCTRVDEVAFLGQWAKLYPQLKFTVGVHPLNVNEPGNSIAHLRDAIGKLDPVARTSMLAIGETGLDFFKDSTSIDLQEQLFNQQIDLASELDLPLVIHTRDSIDRTLDILIARRADYSRAVLHCFSGDLAQLDRALAHDLLVSFTGIVTFKNAKLMQQVARALPDNAYMIETDAPYLAPDPLRGSCNHPALVHLVASKLGRLRDQSINKIAEDSTKNFWNFFGQTKSK